MHFGWMENSKNITADFLFNGFRIKTNLNLRSLSVILGTGNRLSTGDVLDVTLEIVQRYVPAYRAYENVSFKIKEFHKHIPVQDTPSIFE